MRLIYKTVGLLALFSALAVISLLVFDFIKTRDAFPVKTYIGNIDVSYLTQEEALAKVNTVPLTQAFTELLTLETHDGYFSFSPEQIGVYMLPEKSIAKAFHLTHKKNYFLNLKEYLLGEPESTPLLLGLNEDLTRSIFHALAEAIQSSPEAATISFQEKNGEYHITTDVIGRKVLVEQSIQNFKGGLLKGESSIPLAIEYSYAKIREKDIRESPPVHLLAAYTTYYGKHDSPNRIHNIKLIASWVDGTVLMPGEIFSAAETLGDVTPEQGFKEAFVIVGGELEPLLGGGACQIATTLFNAASLADLKVLQRRNHTFYFNIYPLGRDAGVYPGQLDFKFENDSGHPILLKTIATDKKLSFRIYGTPTNKSVKFSPATIYGKTDSGKYTPMQLKEVIDNDIPFKTFVTRTVYGQDREIIAEDEIYSYYKLYGDKTNVPIKRPEPR